MVIAVTATTMAIASTDLSFKKKYSEAAIAVRDHVAAYQKTATKLFTKLYLKRLYDDLIYIEEKKTGEQQQKFITGLLRLLTNYDSVDVYLLAHGNNMIVWLNGIDKKLTRKIRLVYNCGCGNAQQYEAWANLGVKYYLAHKGEKSLSPIFFYFFIRKRAKRRSFDKSIAAANKHTSFLLTCIGFSAVKAQESCATLYSF